MSLLDSIKATATGAKVLEEWLGAGGAPVTPDLAQRRANTCLSCIKNVPGSWWEHAVNDPIARTILNHLRVKNDMALKLDRETELGTCSQCSCNLRLKPWMPLEHVKNNTAPEMLSRFPEWCWISKELKPNPATP